MLATTLLLFSTLVLSNQNSHDLYDQGANALDVIHACSAVDIQIPKGSIDTKDASAVDKAWAIVSARYQCLTFVTGVIAGNDLHTVLMNKRLNREAGDGTYSNMCIPPIDQQVIINDMVSKGTSTFTQAELSRLNGGEFVYLYLASKYPCALKDPL